MAALAGVGLLLVATTAIVVVRQRAPPEPVYQGQPVSHWIKVLNNMLRDQQGTSYFEGERPILEIGPPAIPYLINALRDSDSPSKDAYAVLWPKLPRRLQKWLPEPFPPATMRAYAARGLGLFGPDAAIAVPDLIDALHDNDEWVRHSAASALGDIGPKARAAVPALIKGLNDPDKNFRIGCVIGLRGAAQDAPEVLPVFKKLLSNPDSNLRSWTAMALGEIKVEQETVIKILEDTLQDENGNVRGCAVDSLGNIGPAASSAVPPIMRLLALEEQRAVVPDSEVLVWGKILPALGKMGPAARSSVPVLTNLLQSTNPFISAASAEALWAIEPHNVLSIPCLMERLTNGARYECLLALAKIGPEARAALPLVQKYRGDREVDLQLAAAVAAWKLDPSGPPPIDLLEKRFHSPVHMVHRRTAIRLLGDLGPAGRTAIPTLFEAARLADQLMREDARAALKQVQPN
jgi:HEAT repeat protein